jgi:hypothetical protein
VAPPPNQQTPGHLAALYLWGAFGNVVCADDQFTSDGETPALQEFKLLHEILHTMGIVSLGAPHQVGRGHVSDDAHDLMYAGPSIGVRVSLTPAMTQLPDRAHRH